MGYNFEIQYRQRSTNSAANPLSQLPNTHLLLQLKAPLLLDFGDLPTQVAAYPFLSKIYCSYGSSLILICIFGLRVLINITRSSGFAVRSLNIPLLLQEFHCESVGRMLVYIAPTPAYLLNFIDRGLRGTFRILLLPVMFASAVTRSHVSSRATTNLASSDSGLE